MPLVHQREEQADLDRFHFHVIKFIDEQAIIGDKSADHLLFRVIGHGPVQFGDQFRKQDESARKTTMNRLRQETGGQSGFPASRGPVPANNSIQTKTESGMACRFESLRPLDWLESDRNTQQGSSPAAQLNAWADRHSDASLPTGDRKFAVRLLVAHSDDEAHRLLVSQRSRLFRAIRKTLERGCRQAEQ